MWFPCAWRTPPTVRCKSDCTVTSPRPTGALQLDGRAAWGRRLNVLSGGSVRFEPGAVEDVVLILIRGQRIVAVLREECGGELDG